MAAQERTQVGIIGAGPAGLLLARLLKLHGVDSVILEARTRDYVEARIRAGVLEQGTVDLLEEAGVAERLHREGLVHDGVEIAADGRRLRIDFRELTGQDRHRLRPDRGDARPDRGAPRRRRRRSSSRPTDVTIHDIDERSPAARLSRGGRRALRWPATSSPAATASTACSRPSLPASLCQTFERTYPFGWLGILADVPPCSDELIYASHPRGFALPRCARRPAAATTSNAASTRRSRTGPTTRIWDELRLRLGSEPRRITTGRRSRRASRRCAASCRRRCSTAGCSSPATPPTSCRRPAPRASTSPRRTSHYLCRGAGRALRQGRSTICSRLQRHRAARVWKAERFSWWMTMLLHRLHPDDELRGPDAARRAGLSRLVPRRADRARRELCRPAVLTEIF